MLMMLMIETCCMSCLCIYLIINVHVIFIIAGPNREKPFGDVGILAKYHDNNNNNNNNNKPKAKLCVSFLTNHEMPVFQIASKATHFIPILAVCA